MASTRSGSTAGIRASASSVFDLVCLARPTASSVPSTVAMTVEPTATMSVLIRPSLMRSSAASSPYHLRLKPS